MFSKIVYSFPTRPINETIFTKSSFHTQDKDLNTKNLVSIFLIKKE